MTEGWGRYYDAAKDGGPRETLLLALDLFESEGGGERLAVDLGCGEGRDTVELLRRGWRVLAIDAEREAIERLRARSDLDSDAAARLEIRIVSFAEGGMAADGSGQLELRAPVLPSGSVSRSLGAHHLIASARGTIQRPVVR